MKRQVTQQALRSDTLLAENSLVRSFGLKPIPSFSGQDLPTNGQVLQRLFHMQDSATNHKKPIKVMMRDVAEEMRVLYEKVPCEIQRKDHVLTLLMKLHTRYSDNAKNEQRDSMVPGTKTAVFLDDLNKLCDISTKKGTLSRFLRNQVHRDIRAKKNLKLDTRLIIINYKN